MNKELLKQSLIGLLIGGGIVYFSYLLVSEELIKKIFGNESFLIVSLSILLAIFVAIFIHELGHLLSGIVQGFKTELFVVGFLGIHRQGGKLIFFFNKDFQYFGGIAAVSPQKGFDDLRRKYAIIVASGPLFSIVFGVIILIIFNYQDSVFNLFFASTGFISILIFFATTIPNKSGSFFTDRKKFQRLFSSGFDGDVELALLETINQNFIDGNCRRIQLDKLEIIKKDKEPFIQFWGYYFEYHYLRDNEEPVTGALKAKLKSYKKCFSKAMWKTFDID